MEYKIVETPTQHFLAITKRFEERAQVPDFWDECSESGRIGELLLRRPSGIRDLYGLCRPITETQFEYGVAIVLDVATNWMAQAEMQARGLVQWDVPAGTYLVVDCTGDDETAVATAWKWFYEEFLPDAEYVESKRTDLEVYLDTEKDGIFCRLWIPVEKK